MKIIEAMKRLRVIEKRIQANSQRVSQYCTIVTTERPYYDTEEKQSEKVKSLIQANLDLISEYLNLKTAIDVTNLRTEVRVEGKDHSIAELLVMRRKLADLAILSYAALDDRQAIHRAQTTPIAPGEPQRQIKRLYKEEFKYEGINEWQGFLDAIDARLEVVNATTELVTV